MNSGSTLVSLAGSVMYTFLMQQGLLDCNFSLCNCVVMFITNGGLDTIEQAITWFGAGLFCIEYINVHMWEGFFGVVLGFVLFVCFFVVVFFWLVRFVF